MQARIWPPSVTNMRLVIVRGSAVPPYRQLADQIAAAIRSGELKPGDRIPTRKELLEVYEVDLAPNTVQKAVDLLKADGLVFTSPGMGLFVAEQAGDAESPTG